MEEKEIMTVEQVAEYLQLSKNTIYKLVKEGKLPGVMVGNKLRFIRSKVLEALEAGFPAEKPPQEGNTRAGLGVTELGPGLVLYDEEGRKVWSTP